MKTNVRVGICSTGTIHARTAWCWANASAFTALSLRKTFGANVGLSNQVYETSILAAGREFLLDSCDGVTYFVGIDSDMVFPPDAIMRLLAHLDRASKKEHLAMVGVEYPTRREPARSTARYLDSASKGLVEVESMGFGLVAMRVQLMKKLPRPRFDFTYNKKDGSWEGEDVRFCRLLREAGYSIAVDADLSREVKHIATREIGMEVLGGC